MSRKNKTINQNLKATHQTFRLWKQTSKHNKGGRQPKHVGSTQIKKLKHFGLQPVPFCFAKIEMYYDQSRSMGQDENSEKKYLLSRLEELLRLEKQQVNADLKARRKQLGETRLGQKDEFDGLQRKHQEEIALMRLRQQEERRRVEAHFLDKADHLRKEVELLENEMESMNSPSQLANLALDPSLLSFTCSTPTTMSTSSSLMAGPPTSELEAELQCCGCLKVCQPPTKIYQCSEGDLLCSSCLPPTLATCPACGMHLQGRTSRNKALEKLALKLIC